MKIDNNNARQTLETAKSMLAKEKNISPAFLAVLNLLLMFMQVMLDRFGLTSKNSSKPPASDPNRAKKNNKNTQGRKPGGQKGRLGVQLKPT